MDIVRVDNEQGMRDMKCFNLVFRGPKLEAVIKARSFSLNQAVKAMNRFLHPDHQISKARLQQYTSGKHIPNMNVLPGFKYGLNIDDPLRELFEEGEAN